MTKIITKNFKHHVVNQLTESITEPANTAYYVVFGNHVEYPSGDDSIPSPVDTVNQTHVTPFEQGIFGKKIQYNDVASMSPRYDWTSNTVYYPYDNDTDLTDKKYYTVTTDNTTYYVYKCLDNNSGAPSTILPSDTVESACNFSTNDGYVWKLMYKLPANDFTKFATSDFMPVVTSANVAANSLDGAIDIIRVVNNGSSYIATFTGQFLADDVREYIPNIAGSSTTYRLANSASSNTNFYVGSGLYISNDSTSNSGAAGQLKKIIDYYSVGGSRIAVIESPFTVAPAAGDAYLIAPYVVASGDGTTNATGYAVVSSNASVNNYISKINVIERGEGFTYATATIQGNTGGISNTATLKAILPPKGGHGSDAYLELGSTSLGVSITLNTTESGYVSTENDYRSISIIRDPLFDNVTLTLTDTTGTFLGTEKIHQVDYITLVGNTSTNTSSNTVTGSLTEFHASLKANDQIIIFDPANNLRCMRTVTAVTNSTSLTVNTAPSFVATIGKIEKLHITATGSRSGNSIPYISMSNAEPKFVTDKYVIGEGSGGWGKVTAISVNEKSYNNWSTFDNRTRISYTSMGGAVAEDAKVYQASISLSNAYYHSSNSTYVFLTSEKGTINADPTDPLIVLNTGTTINLGSVKYQPDLVKGSGELMYIENLNPISRSNTQSETIRIILSF
jgi:hypothetical protein